MKRQMNILLVEDDNLDAMMIERALNRVAPDATVKRAVDGLEGLELIEADVMPKPYFVLLDINMPRMNGHEFLRALRASQTASDSIVFMFTTSDSAQDIAEAYRERVSGYIVKPQGTAGMNTILHTLQGFWTACEPPFTPA
ncbi:response regulator [Phaeobacter sp. B1627]|uniref:response regulator n=1 Tax=Phaeobacter sp. B1627 TaxID=2583809 RepID=UPI001118F9EF|nr:response regulator [Phaeobacter sp. B1627]TNJ45113.1 response regulator [Phaeobacter sp. B1627]